MRRTTALALVSLLAFASSGAAWGLASYVSFKYPIKQDRYRHHFSEHLIDRLTAYLRLLRSERRGSNAVMPVESIQQTVRRIAEKHGVEPCLVAAVATFESGLNPNTITTTGAMGLMALQPHTADVLGVQDPFDPEQNVDGGARLLEGLLNTFDGDARLALAGYNAGSDAVHKHAGVPPYRETQDYVSHVGAILALCRAQPTSFFASSAEEK